MKANTCLLSQDDPAFSIYFPYKVNNIQYFDGGTAQVVVNPLPNIVPVASSGLQEEVIRCTNFHTAICDKQIYPQCLGNNFI